MKEAHRIESQKIRRGRRELLTLQPQQLSANREPHRIPMGRSELGRDWGRHGTGKVRLSDFSASRYSGAMIEFRPKTSELRCSAALGNDNNNASCSIFLLAGHQRQAAGRKYQAVRPTACPKRVENNGLATYYSSYGLVQFLLEHGSARRVGRWTIISRRIRPCRDRTGLLDHWSIESCAS